MGYSFSATDRQSILQTMVNQELDLLVIGGGITGAGIALDASLRGLKVGLVEKGDFGSGTSSRSTKLVHGGLRYLKQGEFKLVREVGKERAILYRNAPHLVTPVPMLLPIYKSSTYSYLASSIGLYLYDMLAGVPRKERRKMLNRKETAEQEPLLKTEGLRGGGLYYEYRTDDARLTLDIMKTARSHGAQVVNYAEVTRIIKKADHAVGLEVEDRIHGGVHQIFAKHIVNAAGPWVDQLRELDGSLEGKQMCLTKGVHLVVHHHKVPVKQAAYFDTPDGRMVFVIPRGCITYIGTTDTAYSLDINTPRTTAADRDYLIHAVNAMFPDIYLRIEDILSHWAGLRPLIYEEGKGPSQLSRKDEIFISSSGFITIAGGKLTGFRLMAEKVVNLVVKRLETKYDVRYPFCTTKHVIVSGGEMKQEYATFHAWKAAMVRRGLQEGIDVDSMQEWVDLYGTNALRVLDYWAESRKREQPRFLQLLHAQIMYSINEEMTVTVADFLRLRTGWSYFQINKAQKNSLVVFKIMDEALEWNAEQREQQRKQIDALFLTISELPLYDQVKESK